MCVYISVHALYAVMNTDLCAHVFAHVNFKKEENMGYGGNLNENASEPPIGS